MIKKSSDPQEKRAPRRLLFIAIVTTVLVGIMWSTSWYWHGLFVDGELKPSDRALIGDSFGLVNALFSALALTGIIIAILIQSRELELQRRELRESTLALNAQRVEFEEQVKAIRHQTLDTHFFQLLNSWQNLVRNTRVGVNGQGQQAFEDIAQYMEKVINNHPEKKGPSVYEQVYGKYQGQLGHYFRLLYHLIRFVDSATGLTADQRYEYVMVVRAHLSQPELELLVFNGTSSRGIDKLFPLIEKYRLVKNIALDKDYVEDQFFSYDENSSEQGN